MSDLQRILDEALAREERLRSLLDRAIKALDLANTENKEWAALCRQATEIANAFKADLESARDTINASNETMLAANETIANLRAENERLSTRLRRLS